jgi:vancomycin resistance protein YoaR
VPVGRDATVSYGTIDFVFKNNRTYPIKIKCKSQNGISEIEIKGIKEETEYEVIIESEVTEVLPYSTRYIQTDELPKNEEEIIQKGHNGYKTEAYKILKLNGKIVSKTLLSKDSYNPMQEVIKKGIK